MIRLIFSSLLVFHGLLHLIGFAKEWNIGSRGQLSRKAFIALSAGSSRVAGILWLATGLLFVSAAVLYLLRREWYWIPAACALLVSQSLILVYWQDARYGTLVNIVVLAVVIISAAAMRFDHAVRREVSMLRSEAQGTEIAVTEEIASQLPQNVQRWLKKSGVTGNAHPNIIRIVQNGRMRLKPDGPWLPFDAVQYFSVDPPAFVWKARVRAATLFDIAAKDSYRQGKGHMVIKPLYVLKTVNSQGPEIDQGSMLRYLAEMAWFPQAAVSRWLSWEAIDDGRAKVTMNYEGVEAAGIYTFDEAGNVTGFEARRYGYFEGIYRKETWSIAVTGYKTFNNHLIGNTSEVTWKLREGDFTWLEVEVSEIN